MRLYYVLRLDHWTTTTMIISENSTTEPRSVDRCPTWGWSLWRYYPLYHRGTSNVYFSYLANTKATTISTSALGCDDLLNWVITPRLRQYCIFKHDSWFDPRCSYSNSFVVTPFPGISGIGMGLKDIHTSFSILTALSQFHPMGLLSGCLN